MVYTVTLNPAVGRELVVSAIEFDSVLRPSDWRVDCGGTGFNVSRLPGPSGVAAVGARSVGQIHPQNN